MFKIAASDIPFHVATSLAAWSDQNFGEDEMAKDLAEILNDPEIRNLVLRASGLLLCERALPNTMNSDNCP